MAKGGGGLERRHAPPARDRKAPAILFVAALSLLAAVPAAPGRTDPAL